MLPKVPTPIPWQLALQGKRQASRRVRVGVLALQGDFLEHRQVLEALGAEVVEVRLPQDLHGVEGLIIPGGESTTIARLLDALDMRAPLVQRIREGMPTWGTCAGMILLAKRLREDRPIPLGVMDIVVARNAFGRQVDSFEADLAIEGLEGGPFRAVFIRAPVLLWAGPEVRILARLPDGTPVAARQGSLLATAFHPELTADLRLHQWFLDMVSAQGKG
ncbi:MAG: pyridoxal 5'-phosphate synthase glutaminase subunit PdxT [Dehalococcoidia bacterium]|nr:pyridoxal 5'-phosphate synthase glutaminase subunit PdxT [Dehalococcoidia bacterium]MDW8119690.1 pyridoxal 5'-phosphate synthase glutaminase subunit PdxT [Chloroflexota bacterium]